MWRDRLRQRAQAGVQPSPHSSRDAGTWDTLAGLSLSRGWPVGAREEGCLDSVVRRARAVLDEQLAQRRGEVDFAHSGVGLRLVTERRPPARSTSRTRSAHSSPTRRRGRASRTGRGGRSCGLHAPRGRASRGVARRPGSAARIPWPCRACPGSPTRRRSRHYLTPSEPAAASPPGPLRIGMERKQRGTPTWARPAGRGATHRPRTRPARTGGLGSIWAARPPPWSARDATPASGAEPGKPRKPTRSRNGRGGFRTCDLSRVKRALSH
jgi:hypothetical protein